MVRLKIYGHLMKKLLEAIAATSIPVISSAGHETDTTIADLVADVRAATQQQLLN